MLKSVRGFQEIHVGGKMAHTSIETTKVQERGVVTLPRRVREKLGLKKGSTVAFVETAEGQIEIRPIVGDVIAALDEIGAALKERGLTLEQLIESGREIRQRLYQGHSSQASGT
jgi:AbrB family looped-hinge helix DNA binding protein